MIRNWTIMLELSKRTVPNNVVFATVFPRRVQSSPGIMIKIAAVKNPIKAKKIPARNANSVTD